MDEEPKIRLFPFQLQVFFDKLLDEAGFGGVSSELKKAMIQDLSLRLETWLFQDLKKHLKEKELQQLEELISQGASQQELQGFLVKTIPDCQNIIAQSILDFKDTFLRGVKR